MPEHRKHPSRGERKRSPSSPPMPAKQPKRPTEQPDGGEVMQERLDEDEITQRGPRAAVRLPEDEQ